MVTPKSGYEGMMKPVGVRKKVLTMIASPVKRIVVGGLLAAISVLMVGCPDKIVVIFPDDHLEAAVREALRKPFGFITAADMSTLTELDARNLGISDLRGLQFATNLFSLNVSNETATPGSVNDLTPLADLVNLTFLNLQNNDINDVTPVAGLFNLDQLLLAGNEIFNIGPIVANAENGGLGPGDTLTLSPEPLFDEDGNTSQIIADQLDRLVELGIDVAFIEFGAV